MTTGRGRIVAVLVALIAIVWFANLDARRLIRPDEGRYAELAREMTAVGLTVLSVTAAVPTLEDLFIGLTAPSPEPARHRAAATRIEDMELMA